MALSVRGALCDSLQRVRRIYPAATGMATYFAVLGIPENTDDERVIKSAYRKMALRHHSDRGGRDADMVKVNRAYEVLRDRASRQRYREVVERRAAERQGRYESDSEGTYQFRYAATAENAARPPRSAAPSRPRHAGGSAPDLGPLDVIVDRVARIVVSLVAGVGYFALGFLYSIFVFSLLSEWVWWLSPDVSWIPCWVCALLYVGYRMVAATNEPLPEAGAAD